MTTLGDVQPRPANPILNTRTAGLKQVTDGRLVNVDAPSEYIPPSRGHTVRLSLLSCLGLLTLSLSAPAQQLTASLSSDLSSSLVVSSPERADAPDPGATGSISGTVRDRGGDIIPGALVTLIPPDPTHPESTQAGSDGTFLFAGVRSGPYKLTIDSPGFDPWTGSATLGRGETLAIPEIALAISPVTSAIEVRASGRDIAEAQMSLAEKQRVLGVFPNFYASYVWNAEPLTAGEKYRLAWRFSVDPVAFGVSGVIAAAEQRSHSFPGYGPGVSGYAKRYGAAYADGFSSTMLGQAVFPALLHQDPRYFVKGTGSIPSRALYAIATTVICRGDNGHWQVNYSNIGGNVASASLSNLYYPAANRNGVGLTVENSLVTTALGAVGGLIQEFLLHRMTPNIPNYNAAR